MPVEQATTTPQQFGEYLLFRRLTTDGLGETYRAGKIGNQGIERVVLLRLFNGAGIEAEGLWRTIADRMGLHRLLQNPHIGDGADVGRVGATPYVAYEYVSGKNLAELLSQARARAFQIPTEHALFIMERVTFGLSAAYSTRHRDQRVQHGFLVPETVLLSNEGEVRLIGFESAPALREFLKAAPIRESFGPYLAPDVEPGSQPAPTDDVFALGSLLYELLTGKRLVHPPDGNYDPLVDEAVLAAEEQPLPPSLRALLKSSLAPKAQRIGDVQQWQQAFGRFMAEAAYSPTTFNLAFFMHTLFGGEIEQETLDIAREKATQVDVAALTQVDEPTPGPSDTVLIPPGQSDEAPSTDSGPIPEASSSETVPVGGQYGGGKRKGANWKLLVPLFVLAIAAGLAAAYYWSTGRTPAADSMLAETDAADLTEPLVPAGDEIDVNATDADVLDPMLDVASATAAAAAAAAPEPEAVDAPPIDSIDTSNVDVPPTPEEVEDQIARLVDDRANTLEAKYEEELAALRDQLEQARLAQEAAALEAQAEAEAEAEAQEATTPPVGAQSAPETPAPGAAKASTEPRSTQPSGTGATASESRQVAPGIKERVDTGESPKEPSAPAQPTPPTLGEIVEMGPGVTRPKMTRRPQPRYPPAARRLNKHADVNLRVLVDENGNVAEIQQVGDRVGFGFDDAAEAAAGQTRWVAATKLGVRVKMWVDLKISFRP